MQSWGTVGEGRKKVEKTKKEVINNAKLLEESGLRVVHILPINDYPGVSHGGMTIAYRPTARGMRTVEISTSVCSPRDTWTRKNGTKLAIEHFLAGHTLRIPVFRALGVVGTIKSFFH